jgi:hypothetical protein
VDHGPERPSPRQRGARALSGTRSVLVSGLHLAVLSAFALAQPLFDLLGRNAEFFAVRDSTRWDVVAFAVGLVLVPPLAILAAEIVAGLAHPLAASVLHLAALAVLVALIAVQIGNKVTAASSAVLLPVAAVLGAVAALAYVRAGLVRSFLTVLAPVPLVFLGLFLLATPVRKLVLEREPRPLLVDVESDTPVVLLVFDEISTTSLLAPDGEIDSVRYPNIAALARDATWFRNAATIDAWTVHAVPAVLTGVEPEHGTLPLFSEHRNNVFTLLGGRYRLHVSESLTELCPRSLCPEARRPFGSRMGALLEDVGVVYLHLAAPRDLRARLPSVTGTWGAFLESSHERTRERLGRFRAFVASIDGGRDPTLSYAHVMFPHIPWEYLPSGRRYRGDATEIPGFEGTAWSDDRYLVDQAHQRYLLQLQFADRLLGELVARLRATGVYDRALLIVMADHGVSFRPNDRRRAFTDTNLEDVAFMPLLVKRPGETNGRIEDKPVQSIDVLPTIADVLDVEVPWRMHGKSLFAPRADERYVFVGDKERVSLSAGELVARRDIAFRRQQALFGSGLYRVGPHPELLGRRTDAVAVSVDGAAKAQIDQEGELRSVDLGSSYIPARLTGLISGGGSAPRDLAVALDGRIVAVARSFLVEGEERLSVLMPESALVEGANDVELFWVRRGGPSPLLVRLSAG